MRIYSFVLLGARFAYLLVIIRADGTVIRVTGYNEGVTIDANFWSPEPGLQIGDYMLSNNGEVPSLSVKVAMRDDGPFNKEDISNRLFENAQAFLYITDARSPSLDDLEVEGKLRGEVRFDLNGNAEFELLNKFNLDRDVAGRVYTIKDDSDFGDHLRNKIPTFPTVDETSDDLADVARSAAYILGERRRFRYASGGNPSDYHNVYWEVTTAGTTGGSVPVTPSDTPEDTVSDGSVTWTVRNAFARAGQIASIVDDNHVTIAVTEPRATDPTWFERGMVWMRSGYLNGMQSDISAWDGASELTLVKPFGAKVEVGDWFEIAPGYNKTLSQAVDRYGAALTSLTEPNSADGGANNYRGFPHITGTRFFMEQFIPGVSVDSPPDADDPGAGDGGGGGGGGYEAFAVEFEAGSD